MSEIETERLRLRMFKPADFDAIYNVWSDRDVMRYIYPAGWPHSREESRVFVPRLVGRFEQHGWGQWAVVVKDEEKLIGYCGLKFLDDTPEVELLYGIAKDYWNRGLVTEVAKATLRFGFEEARLAYIVAIALAENAGSWRVMEKAGMRRDGTMMHAGLEHLRYKLTRDEFAPDAAPYILRRRPE